jgi:GNAT superfamily N-acetyltransferase
MTLPPPSEHFQGKSVVEHLREARTRGVMASAEVHGTEMPGHLAAAADAAKEVAVAFLILAAGIVQFSLPASSAFFLLLIFACGWLIWKTGRSALLGYARLERLHRVIEEERWEIEHHRNQEREELTEMYRAKGLSGKLLEEVIDVLMADDNRLLKVMLEEELGLTLEAYEHPLKQSVGAALGVLIASTLCLIGFSFKPLLGTGIASFIILIIAGVIGAKLERNRPLTAAIWNVALAAFSAGAAYLFAKLLLEKVFA